MIATYFAMPKGIYGTKLPEMIKEFLLDTFDVSGIIDPSDIEYQTAAKKKADNYATLEQLSPRDPEVGATRMAFFENLAGDCDSLYFLAFPDKVDNEPFFPNWGLKLGSGKGAVVHTNNRIPAGVVREIQALLLQGKPVFEVVMNDSFSEAIDIKRVKNIDRPEYTALTPDTTAILNNKLTKLLAEKMQ